MVCTVALYVIMSGCVCTDMYAHWQGEWVQEHRGSTAGGGRLQHAVMAMEIRFGERTNEPVNDKVMICRLFSVGLAQSVSIMVGKLRN